MEKKTIGSFIATLRKANGMTQKELAEKCNVSDKTISRWEREDGVPDLALIPVLAEIFGVTCDELLRGEKLRKEKREEEGQQEFLDNCRKKQRRRILAVGLTKYKNKSFIAVGVVILGMIAAMIGNLGFLRAYVGFFAGVIFYLTGVICQIIFLNHAMLTVEDEEGDAEEIGAFRRKVVRLAEVSIGLAVVLLAATLPLGFVQDTYMGLSAESWLRYGSVYGVVALAIVCVVCHFFNGKLFKKAGYNSGEKEEKKYRYNYELVQRCVAFTALIMLLTGIFHNIATCGGSEVDLSEGTEFYDYESFGEYMARPEVRSHYYGDGMGAIAVEPVGKPTYYDALGNVITEEEALTRELYDGNGNVVYRYVDRNENVCSVRYSVTEGDEDCLPITVITYDDLQSGRMKLQMLNILFGTLYCLEAVIGVSVYYKKRI